MEASTGVVMIREGDIQSYGGTRPVRTRSRNHTAPWPPAAGRPRLASRLAGLAEPESGGRGVRAQEVA